MSRSRRKTKIHGITTAPSEKQDKRLCNRIVRRGNRQLLPVRLADFIDITKRDAFNVWSMGKDGKQYWPDMPAYMMRK